MATIVKLLWAKKCQSWCQVNWPFRVRKQSISIQTEHMHLKNNEIQHHSAGARFQIFNEFIGTLPCLFRHLKIINFYFGEVPTETVLRLFPSQFNLPRKTANNFIFLETPLKSTKKKPRMSVGITCRKLKLSHLLGRDGS